MSTMVLDEAARLAALWDLQVLDTEPEAEFEAIVAAAAAVCGMPISLISLVDDHRQWFKANVGLPGVSETPRSAAFCAHTIQQHDLLEVTDATRDQRFADNPLVTGSPDIRFYAGAPLRLADGSSVGSLCVIDDKPGKLTETQREVLVHLSRAAARALETRRATQALIVSESRFRTLSAASPLGVFSTDADGGCTYTNRRWREIFGLSDEDARGNGWCRTLHPDDKKPVILEWNRVAALHAEFEMEFRILHDDGQVILARAMSRPVFDDQNTLVGHVGSVEDVTTVRNQRDQQRRSELLLQQTGALAQVGGWELDLATGHTEVSAQTRRIFGVPPDQQFSMKEAISFFEPKSRVVIADAVQRAIEEGVGWDTELQLRQVDGHRIWVRVVGKVDQLDGKAIRLRGAIQDIDESVRQRLALEDAHERITIATDSGEIGVWEYDIHGGGVKWSSQMFKLYGIEEHDEPMAYQDWVNCLHPDDRAEAQRILAEAVEGEHELDYEFRIVWPDGSVHHLHSTARVKRDVYGRAQSMLGVNWDMTPLHSLTSQLSEQHEMLHVTLQSIADAVITADTTGLITWLNPSAEKLTAWTRQQAVGKPLEDVYTIVDEQTGASLESPVAECLRDGKRVGQSSDTLLMARNGVDVSVEDSAAPIRDSQGELLGVVLVFRDVSEQRHLARAMTYRATHDELTQLYNRSEFESRLELLLATSQRESDGHALMFIDLDQFKLVNDACGHTVGDQLLRQMGAVLGQSLGDQDTLARLGGDEFGVILKDCTLEQAQKIAQEICDRMDDFRFVNGEQRFRIGVSIGLVPLDGRLSTRESILQAADTSCYAAKEAGRNRVHLWFDTDQAMQVRQDDMQWAARLEQSLDEGRFELFGQRLLALNDKSDGVHAEVLVRLRDDQGNLTLPGAFLPAAERFHLASRIDRWVLQEAIYTLDELQDNSGIGMLWINLSGQSVSDRVFHRDAIQMLKQAGDDICQRICMEITETAAITNIADAAEFINRLSELGVCTALDDFGAGASSFGYLKTLPVNVLKIDGQFITDVVDDPLDEAAVRCFVDVAAVVGLKTVAEHVDSVEVLERVRSMGVDLAQGFMLHKPQPIGEVLSSTDDAWDELSQHGDRWQPKVVGSR